MSPATRKWKREAAPVQPQAEKGLELLFEVGCEEIPAGMVAKAAGDLKAYLEKLLTAESIGTGVTVETFGGPRRLTVWAQNLPRKQADVVNEVTGPPKSVAYDSVGEPTFLVGGPEELGVRETSAQHPLMPGAYQPLGVLSQINDRQERWGEFPAPLL